MKPALQPVPAADFSLRPLVGKRVAVLGYGAQGRAHALNLRDSGIEVIVSQRPGRNFELAAADGFSPLSLAEAAQAADLLISGLPDDTVGRLFDEHVRPWLHAGQTLGFIHGFAIHYEEVRPPADVDVVLVAPKAQGRGVRSAFVESRGVVSLIGIYQDVSGSARDTALAWATGIGSHRAGAFETSFADETETDLFGEQAVLCGGLSALVTAGYETLVEAGYPPELAYFECCHELKLLTDLIHEHGIAGMRRRISSTARFGDLVSGPAVIGQEARAAMRRVLDNIRSGAFAKSFLEDRDAGGPTMRERLAAADQHPIEQTGERVRRLARGETPPPGRC